MFDGESLTDNLYKFQNRYPEDIYQEVFRSKLIFRENKWIELLGNLQERTASGVYNFVTQEQNIFIRKASAKIGNRPIGHLDLARGAEVDYAGRLYFSGRNKRGILRKWTNESGHYQPPPEFKHQACLPEELFQPGRFDSLIGSGISSV